MARTRLPAWPYPAPGQFAEWKFAPTGAAGSVWMLSPADDTHQHGMYLTGSIRKGIFQLKKVRHVGEPEREYRSLRKAEAAYVAYMLSGELPP